MFEETDTSSAQSMHITGGVDEKRCEMRREMWTTGLLEDTHHHPRPWVHEQDFAFRYDIRSDG